MNFKVLKWDNIRIKNKMIILNMCTFTAAFIILICVSYYINRSSIIEETGENSIKTINVIEENLNYIFNDVSLSADYVYFDSSIQKKLKKVNKKAVSIETQAFMTDKIINILLGNDYLSSIILVDSYGNIYSSYRADMVSLNYEEIKKTNLYDAMVKANGDGIFLYDCDGTVKFRDGSHSIVYARQVVDLDTYRPIAFLLATVDINMISDYFRQVVGDSKDEVCIVSDKGEYIAGTDIFREGAVQRVNAELSKSRYEKVKIEGNSYIEARKQLSIPGWNLMSFTQVDRNKLFYSKYASLMLLIGAVCIFFILGCVLLLNGCVFAPLLKLEKHMMTVEQGNLSRIPLEQKQNEITNLQHVYNHMIVSIKELIEKVKNEEKTIAKGELELIQAQINPHFLYNTLDAISALSLINDNKRCFQMTQALGNFYRNSLNNGRNTVTIAEEIECIKNYIIVLNIRHNDSIQFHIDVEEALLDVTIPKLLIQPLIENAVLHGVNEIEGDKEISLSIFTTDDEIIISVKDNGIGMSTEKIAQVQRGELRKKHGFGIYSLNRRIELLYGIKTPMIIHSEPGNGTEIDICIGREIKS